MTTQEREAREHSLIVDHLEWQRHDWETCKRMVKEDAFKKMHLPDPLPAHHYSPPNDCRYWEVWLN